MQLASKNNFDQRAVELLEMLGNPQLVQLAAKYANKLKKSTLAQKLLDISFKPPDSDEEEENDTNCVRTFCDLEQKNFRKTFI